MSKRQDDDIDLERAAMDPQYRRRVLQRLKAESEGRESGDDDLAVPDTRSERRDPASRRLRR